MISTSGLKVCLWGMSNIMRGRERMSPISGVLLGWKTIRNSSSAPDRQVDPNVVESNNIQKKLDQLQPSSFPKSYIYKFRERLHKVNQEAYFPNVVESSIKEKLDQLQPSSFLKSCIYKFRERLHKVNQEAYKPMLVSIGPHHRKSSNQCEMNKLKLRYLHSLLERRKRNSLASYIDELKNLEKRARDCYAHSTYIDHMTSAEFVEMMLVDGCFIIEFVRKCYLKHLRDIDIDESVERHICRDMMLLENQIPYFVLSRLYDLTKDPEEKPFVEMAMSVLTSMLLKSPPPLAITR